MRQIKHWLSGLVVAAGLAATLALPAGAQTAPPSPNPGEMVLGRPDAPVTVIEYASLTCPHCAHFHEEVWPELKKQYVDTGKVRFIYRDFPLDEAAMRGSQLARCKGDTESFFAFADILFTQQRNWATQNGWGENLAQIARLGGVGSDQFKACMNDKALQDSILKSRLDGGNKYNISGTPTLVVNEKNVGSPSTFEEMRKAIDAVLPRGSTSAPATTSAAPATTAPAQQSWWAKVKSWFGS